MKVTVVRPDELDSTLQSLWNEFQTADPFVASPYFSLDYVRAAGRVIRGVRVSVIEVDGAVQGFFPFEITGDKVAAPVGQRLCDWNGLILRRGSEIDPLQLVRASGILIWDFDHVPASQHWFEPHTVIHDVSPIMDVSRGYLPYLEQRKVAGAQRVSQMLRKARKFEREVGPLRFEPDCRDPRAFEQVVAWKRDQCLRTGVPDFLSWGWTTDLLKEISVIDTERFAGRLSVLWHEDTILGAHFGMRSDVVWHWWLPGYNDAFAAYSPGGVLLLRVAEAAAADGLRYVDLGRGQDEYKQSFATDALPLLHGSVMVPSIASVKRRARTAGTTFVKTSPVLGPARAVYRSVRSRR